MPGAGDNTVTITIQTVDASSGAISNVETKLNTLGTAGTAAGAKVATVGREIDGTGEASRRFGADTMAATGIAGAGFDSVRGRIDSARLAAEEMGIRVPRAMLRVVAGNEAMAAGFQALMGVMVAVGAVAIFTQLIEGAAHLYEKWFDVTKGVEAYQDKAREAASQKLLETASIEETIALLKQAEVAVDDFEKKRTAAHIGQIPGAGWMQYGQYLNPAVLANKATGGAVGQEGNFYTSEDDQSAAKAQAKKEAASDRERNLDQQFEMQRLKGQAAYDSAVDQGYAKIASHERDAINENNLRSQQEQANAKALAEKSGQFYDPKSGESQRLAANAVIEQEAAGQRIALARTEQQTIITAQNEAANAHLQGIALVQSQEEQAIDAVVRKFYLGEISKQGMIAESAAIWEKFEAQKLLKMQEEQRLVDAAFAHAGQVGDTGTKAIRNEQQDKISAIPISTDPEKAVGLRVAYEQEGDNKVVEAREKFVQEMGQIDQRADDQMLQGYARVDAEAQKLITAAQTKFTEANKGANLENPTDYAKYAAEYQAEQDAETRIQQNAQRERATLTQRDAEETAKIEAEAARASLPPWLAAQQRIREEFDETAQKAKADLDAQLAYFTQVAERQHGLTTEQATAQQQVWNQYYQVITADAARASAEMEKQQEETRDKIAGALTSLMDNPAKYMEQRGKQLMTDMLANWMMQLTEAKGPMGSTMAWIFGMNPEMSTSTNPKTALGSIFAPQHHGAAGAGGSTLSAGDHALVSAGSTVNAAGDTLNTAGLKLSAAADVISAAMQGFGSGAAPGAGGGGGGGGGALTPGGGTGDFTDAITTGMTNAINAPTSSSSGVMGTPPGTSAGAIGQGTAALTSLMSSGGSGGATMGESIPLLTTLAKGGVFGSTAQNFASGTTMPGAFNAGGPGGGSGSGSTAAAMPSMGMFGGSGAVDTSSGLDIGATEDSGMSVGVNPDSEGVGVGATEDGVESGDSGGIGGGGGFGLAQGMGIGMAGIGAGMTIAQNWGNPNIGSAMLGDAMAGASLGTAIMPGIGTAIGAIGGAIIGLFGSLFGDQGASKMRQYNTEQVIPAITKEMTAYTAAEVGYDQGTQDMQTLELKAQAQARQWGSGAMGVYTNTVAPEINVAITEMQRQQDTGRAGAITMQAAQYDSGGVISHFGDFSTGPNSGYIHARVGETVMNPMASMVHSDTLSAMNRGADISRGTGSGLGGNSGGGGGDVHLHIHTIDSQDTARWLRTGGVQQIQSHLNANATRYAGKALSA
jgi:hypothetical protein